MMTGSSEHITALPFFPLSILLLPGEKAPLRIFEPRYKQLIGECVDKPFTFGIPYIRNRQLTGLGAEVRLDEVLEVFENGEMIITVEGVSLFRVIDYEKEWNGKLYGGGRIILIQPDMISRDRGIRALAEELQISTGDPLITPGAVDLMDLARGMNLNAPDKFHLLEMDNPVRREAYLKGLLQIEKRIREQHRDLADRLQMN